MNKDQVAEVLLNIATLLELKGENPFKSRAYVNAARALDTLSVPLDQVVRENQLGEIRGIGDALQKKIAELVTTGRLVYYEELKASTPPGLLLLLEIPGLGPKKIKILHEQLGITSIESLEQACKDGKVAELKGFGEKTQTNICAGINRRRTFATRQLLYNALPIAESLLDQLREHEAVIRCCLAGSVRRYREVIGDIDLLASTRQPGAVLDYFTQLRGVANVLAKGETKASVLLDGGMQCDLRVVRDSEYAFALMYFTGSKEHNIILRQRAIARGLRLNEYGLFRSATETHDPALLVPCETEHRVYQELGLHFVPPEMREDIGEVVQAEDGPLPRLIEWTDIRGSLHNHSTWSDGRMTPEDIAKAMRELGLSYWGITDHSKSSVQANGLSPERLQLQLAEVRALNEHLIAEGTEFRLLTGAEVDILQDGEVDFSDEVLAQLDVVIASIHQSLTLSETENTRRLITAAQNPYVHILGHVTGRLLLRREGAKINHQAVIDACAETGTWIELNASPERLDMDWRFWPYSKSKGVKCVINCDAHRFEHAGYLRLGVGMARKAGLTKEDVINTLPYARLATFLKAKRERPGIKSL
jgi:DNA polymerase (family 10)